MLLLFKVSSKILLEKGLVFVFLAVNFQPCDDVVLVTFFRSEIAMPLLNALIYCNNIDIARLLFKSLIE